MEDRPEARSRCCVRAMAAGPGARRRSSAVGAVLRLGLLGAVLGTAQTAVYFREQFLDGGCGKGREGEGVMRWLAVRAVSEL